MQFVRGLSKLLHIAEKGNRAATRLACGHDQHVKCGTHRFGCGIVAVADHRDVQRFAVTHERVLAFILA